MGLEGEEVGPDGDGYGRPGKGTVRIAPSLTRPFADVRAVSTSVSSTAVRPPSTATPGTDRVTTAREPGVLRSFSLVLVVTVGAVDGLRAVVL